MYVQVCMYATCVPGACEGWESMLDPLERELQVAANHHVGAGNQTQVLCKSQYS